MPAHAHSLSFPPVKRARHRTCRGHPTHCLNYKAAPPVNPRVLLARFPLPVGPEPSPVPRQPAHAFRVEDWFRLPTATVEVRRHGTYVRTSRVEEATPESRMLLLSPEGVEPSIIIDKLDGYEVWIDPGQHHYCVQQHRTCIHEGGIWVLIGVLTGRVEEAARTPVHHQHC